MSLANKNVLWEKSKTFLSFHHKSKDIIRRVYWCCCQSQSPIKQIPVKNTYLFCSMCSQMQFIVKKKKITGRSSAETHTFGSVELLFPPAALSGFLPQPLCQYRTLQWWGGQWEELLGVAGDTEDQYSQKWFQRNFPLKYFIKRVPCLVGVDSRKDKYLHSFFYMYFKIDKMFTLTPLWPPNTHTLHIYIAGWRIFMCWERTRCTLPTQRPSCQRQI